jgi:class 3 adenylate cyclase
MADPKSPAAPDASSTDAPGRRRRKLSAIMMADVSGFSRMMGKNEDATVDLIKEFHDRVLRLVEQFEGRVVDTAGDSVFGEFDSVVNAVRCACRIQEEQAALNAGRQADERIETRIGVHLGDVIVEDYRVYGDGVNIAARLEPLADPGGICISEAVYQQIRNKLDLPMEDVGLKQLKNIEHPIRLYKVAPVREVSRDTVTAPPQPAPVAARPHPMPAPVGVEFLGTSTLILSSTGAFLLLSPILLFSTGGVLATGGAVLLSLAFGREWARRTRRSGNLLIALGIGLASGAAWTNWSKLTNGLFLLAGVIVAASGLGGGRHQAPKK